MAFVFVGRQIKYTDTYSNTVHGHTSTKFPDTNKGQPHNTPGKGERAVTLEKSLLINNKQRPCVCYFPPLLFPWWLFKQCSLLLVYPEFWDGCKQMRIYDVIFASGCFYDVMVFFCMLGWSEVTQSCPIYDFKTLNLKYRSVQLRRNGSIWFDKRLSTASLNFFYLMVVFFFVLFRGEDSTAPGPTTVYRFVPSFYTEDLLCLNTDCNSKLILGLFLRVKPKITLP